MLSPEIGYIKLTSFTENCSNEVKEAFLKLKDQQCKSLILDLRGNPGGLLNEAVNIVNLFVDKGQEIVFTKGKIKDWDNSYLSVNNALDTQIPLIVMVDNNSASASEIVAGALQDLDRAVVLGQRSFGKGLVQQVRDLTYNTKLKVTVAKYYIPSGRCIQALDYSNKDDEGRVDKVPDSLITAFKTKNGRTVYDGAGVLPDYKTDAIKYSQVLAVLFSKNYIFSYVNQFVVKHPEIIQSKEPIELNDEQYNDFILFLKDKDYNYKTESDYALEDLKTDALKENYYQTIESEYKALLGKMATNKKDDLMRYKSEIKQFIEEEIASRISFQKGRTETALKYDKSIVEAKKLLSDASKLKSILTVIEKPNKPFNSRKKF
jgi:carboxyl-terminal processing protease